jgi:tetratricopeptide (TPR) repeat protein
MKRMTLNRENSSRLGMVGQTANDSDVLKRLQFVVHMPAYRRNLGQALKEVELILRGSPNQPDALILKGQILWQLDRIRSAWKCFSHVTQTVGPQKGRAHLERARILYAVMARNKAALKESTLALRRIGNDSSDRAELWLLRGKILGALHREKAALRAFLTALSFCPDSIEIHDCIGRSYLILGNPRRALSNINKALHLTNASGEMTDTDKGYLLEFKAQALMDLGKLREALGLAKRGLKRFKNRGVRAGLLRIIRLAEGHR